LAPQEGFSPTANCGAPAEPKIQGAPKESEMKFSLKVATKKGYIGIYGKKYKPTSIVISKSSGISPLVYPAAVVLALGILTLAAAAKLGKMRLSLAGARLSALGGALLTLGALLSGGK